MMLFDADGKIRRYESAEEILTEFFDLRLQYYERRRVSLLQARAGFGVLGFVWWMVCCRVGWGL